MPPLPGDFLTINSGPLQARIQADCRALTNGLNIAFLGIKRLGLPESVTKLVFERMESELRDRGNR